MKKISGTAAVVIAFMITQSSFAQTCDSYYPATKGSVIELTTYNEKGKVQSVNTTTVTNVKASGDALILSLHAESKDAKGKDIASTDFDARCEGNTFYMNMKNFIPAEQMAAFKDMEMTVEADELEMPANPSPGQSLKDAHFKMDMSSGGMKLMGLTMDITERKVVGSESITTPAGTFDCIKVTSRHKMKTIIGMEMEVTEWYAKGAGIVRSESHRKGKLQGYTELTKLVKG